MLFNTLSFAGFLTVVFAAYWAVKERRLQNGLLLAASYVFYACWDWRFLAILIGLSAVTHICARLASAQSNNPNNRTIPIWAICILGLGTLGLFKYYNFFADSFAAMSAAVGLRWSPVMLKLGLPMGISFFTFKSISYVVDCYQGKQTSSASWYDTFLYIGFFPQIAAGPIDRATNLLPQFAADRKFDFDQASRGLAQIAYGLFKKMVVADTLCLYVDRAFANPSLYGSIACLIGALFYSIQIYCDFSGYSDVACGTCRLLGFEPMLNFDRPYLSRSFSEFWRRWHISLSFWFRDYVYIPLGGSRVPFWKVVRNLWIVFLLSGLWHGAAWTFVIWGGLHALFQTLGLLKRKLTNAQAGNPNNRTIRTIEQFLVFLGVTFAWIFFRAHSFVELKAFLSVLFGAQWGLAMNQLCAGVGPMVVLVCAAGVALLGLSYLTPRDCAFKTLRGKFLFTLACAAMVILFGIPSGGEFIYFQF